MSKVNVVLKYIGNGFIPGVPARDLSDEEVKQLELEFTDEKGKTFMIKGEKALLKTGLYEKTSTTKKKSKEGE